MIDQDRGKADRRKYWRLPGPCGRQTFFDHPNGFQRLNGFFLLGGNGKRQTVDKDVLFRGAVFLRCADDTFGVAKRSSALAGIPLSSRARPTTESAIFFDQREDAVHDFGLSVDGIYDRLAVVDSQSRFDGFGIGRIQLKREVENRLEIFYCFYHHFRLIDFRQTDVYVQNIGTGLGLFDALIDDIVHVIFDESLFKSLFSRRIDTFSDDADAVDCHDCRRSTDAAFLTGALDFTISSLQRIPDRSDIVGSRPAAAADEFQSDISVLFHRFRKLLRA